MNRLPIISGKRRLALTALVAGLSALVWLAVDPLRLLLVVLALAALMNP